MSIYNLSIFRESLHGTHSRTEHYPWRTEERIKINRYRTKNPLNQSRPEAYTAMQALKKHWKVNKSYTKEKEEEEEETENLHVEDLDEALDDTDNDKETYSNTIQELHIEIDFYQKKFSEERQLRLNADKKIEQLENDNRMMKEKIRLLEDAKKVSEDAKKVSVPLKRLVSC